MSSIEMSIYICIMWNDLFFKWTTWKKNKRKSGGDDELFFE